MINILYISDSYKELSVFESQVHVLCTKHASNINVKLLALYSGKSNNFEPESTKYQLILKRKGRLGVFIPLIFLRAFFLKQKKELLKEIDVIHCRGQVMTLFAFYLCKMLKISIPIISDFRGEIEAEIGQQKKYFRRFWMWSARSIERNALRVADHVFFVSNRMKEHYQKKFDTTVNCSVFPTIVNEEKFRRVDNTRINMRQQLGLSDKFAYIYVGGVDIWQNLDKILISYEKAFIGNSSLYLIILSNAPSDVNNLIKTYCNESTDSVLVKKVNHDQVPNYLNAADAGLIYREQNIINEVAAPTKITEYLASGLKIVDEVKDIGNISADNSHEYQFLPFEGIINEQQNVYRSLSDK